MNAAVLSLTVEDTLPQGSTLVSATSPYVQQGDLIRWEITSLAANTPYTLELTIRPFTSTLEMVNLTYRVFSAVLDQETAGPPVHTRINHLPGDIWFNFYPIVIGTK